MESAPEDALQLKKPVYNKFDIACASTECPGVYRHEDVRLVSQTCTWAHVEFNDQSVADYFDQQVDLGLHPEQFARIWIHSHPANSAEPSGTDEATFKRVFGAAHWAVMFILARGGQTFARMRFNVGPGGDVSIPVEVDYSRAFAGSDHGAWHEEYLNSVQIPEPELDNALAAPSSTAETHFDQDFVDGGWREAWRDYLDYDQTNIEEPYGYLRDF